MHDYHTVDLHPGENWIYNSEPHPVRVHIPQVHGHLGGTAWTILGLGRFLYFCWEPYGA